MVFFETIHPNKADVIIFLPQSNYFVGFISLAVGDNAVQIQREDVYSTAVPGKRKKAWKLSKFTTQVVCVFCEGLLEIWPLYYGATTHSYTYNIYIYIWLYGWFSASQVF